MVVKFLMEVRDPNLSDPNSSKIAANELDLSLAKVSRAAVAAGMDRQTIMRLLIGHAFEVLNDRPSSDVQASNAVLTEALRLHAAFDDLRGPVT